MLENKTIVIDLDGTLLNDEKKISDIDIKCLSDLSINNSIILASGRNYIETIKIVKLYNLQKYLANLVICSNGQQIYSINQNKVIKSNDIEIAEAIDIINTLDKNKFYWYIIDNKNLFCKCIDYNCNKYIDNNRYKINILKSNEDIKKIKIEKFILNTESISKMENVKKILYINYKVDFFKENRLRQYKGIEYFQNNILPREINKYTAVQYIIEELNLSKYIITFGNGINDYEIISNSDFSICMKNSNATIKEISNCITISNNESGISYAIKNLIRE